MFLRLPLLTSGSRTLREASATGGVESQFFSIPLAPLTLFQYFRGRHSECKGYH